jgi:hypothetical protein
LLAFIGKAFIFYIEDDERRWGRAISSTAKKLGFFFYHFVSKIRIIGLFKVMDNRVAVWS